MTLASQKELNALCRELKELDDKALLARLQTACESMHNPNFSKPDPDAIKLMVKPRQELDIFYFECIKRDLGNEYASIYSRRLRKHTQTLRVTDKTQFEAVRHAHCAYTLPRTRDVIKSVQAIDHYAESSNYFNNPLRGQGFRLLNGHCKEQVIALDRAMRPLPCDITVHRGFSPAHGITVNFAEGEIYHDRGFLCTTAKRGVASAFRGRFFLDLLAPAGTPYISTWKAAARNNSYIREEQEIIIGRGRDILIESMVKKRGYTHLQGRILLPAEAREFKRSA